jgi:hypothetical protein
MLLNTPGQITLYGNNLYQVIKKINIDRAVLLYKRHRPMAR